MEFINQVIILNIYNINLKIFILYIYLGKHKIDNRWVVPYNPFLSLKYNCHINVEVASSIKCVKYLFKYIYKGYDCADIKLTTSSINSNNEIIYNHNEIDHYVNSRYISAPEAVHRLFEFRMDGRSHSVIRLALHLPLENIIRYVAGEESVELEKNTKTTLTAWFELNKSDVSARKFKYTEIPEHYVFLQNEQIWKPRQKGLIIIIFNYIFNIY